MISISYVLFYFLCTSTFIAATRHKLTEYVSPCRADDPDLNECVRLTMSKAVPKFSKGVKDLGFIPFEPIEIPRLDIDQRQNTGPIGIMLSFLNSKHYGIGKLITNSVNAQPEKMFFEFNTTIPQYRIVGEYMASGRVLLLPLNGKGPCNFTMTGVNTIWRINGEPEVRHGKVYARIKNSKMNLKVKSGSVYLGNLFNGDLLLGRGMNMVLNENFNEVIKELTPGLEEAFAELNMMLVKSFFASIPYQEIFPGIDLTKVLEIKPEDTKELMQ